MGTGKGSGFHCLCEEKFLSISVESYNSEISGYYVGNKARRRGGKEHLCSITTVEGRVADGLLERCTLDASRSLVVSHLAEWKQKLQTQGKMLCGGCF